MRSPAADERVRILLVQTAREIQSTNPVDLARALGARLDETKATVESIARRWPKWAREPRR